MIDHSDDIPRSAAQAHSAGSRELARFVRARLDAHLHDDSVAAGEGAALGTAIYGLSDPRDVRLTRYVGQTRAPRRRFLQHVRAARLWMPDERPWWIVEERLRPLYEWLRELYRDERRLPVMVVSSWYAERVDATAAERELIQRCLRDGLPLLNVESATLDPQIRLV